MNKTKILQRLLLPLLLISVEVNKALGQETLFYGQDYEGTGVTADWTTSTGGRFTPIIMEEGGNHFMAGDPTQTYNNGATLTGPDLGVSVGTEFVLSFDLRLANSNNNKPEFYITDANGNKFFSLTPTSGNGDYPWIINGSADQVTLATTNYINNTTVSDRHWHRFKLKYASGTTTLTITDLSTNTVEFDKSITTLTTGLGIGRMYYVTGKALAKFAIDNVMATRLFSFNSSTAEVDITSSGTANHPSIDGLPSIINETGTATTITYGSSNSGVAQISNSDGDRGKIYLIGTGVTTITATMGSYTTFYELTVYGTTATVNSSVSDAGTLRTCSWELASSGLLDEAGSVTLGGITMTYSYSGETPIAVYDATFGGYVLKVMDTNGYSHANVSYGFPESAYGGTFYKFTTTSVGTLTVNGRMSEVRLLQSDKSTGVALTSSSSTSIRVENLPIGTYYLYNSTTDWTTDSKTALLHSFTFAYNVPMLEWSANSVTIDIMAVGNTNPNMVSGLPTLTVCEKGINNSAAGYVKGYKSSDNAVATFNTWTDAGEVHICGIGTTTITAIDVEGNTASYTLTVTGNTVTPSLTTNTLTFTDEGLLVNSGDKQAKQYTLSTGLQIDFGFGDSSKGETAIVTNCGMGTVLKLIDENGYSHPNLGSGRVIPWEVASGGTFVKLTPTKNGSLIVTGNVSATLTKLYKLTDYSSGTGEAVPVSINESDNTLFADLVSGNTYYLYNIRTGQHEYDGIYIPPVHSISYVGAYFEESYKITDIANPVTIANTLHGITNPTFTIDGMQGDVSSISITSSSTSQITLEGIKNGGAIRIKATDPSDATNTATYILTVAYKAPEYSARKTWNFNPYGSQLTVSDSENKLASKPVPSNTATDTNGDTWTAFWKNANTGVERGEEWGHNEAVNGDNAFIIPETAGLVFKTVAMGFYMRNDNESYKTIGIRKYGASFTIPQLSKGDIVELNWKHEASNSGSIFTATNVTDLRGKSVDEAFEITESAFRNNDNHPGRYSFIAKGGDVTFTLQDNGNTDILSVTIYKGPYRSTMRNINQQGNIPVPTTLILDNKEDGFIYNYCNQLYSTATGPAMYVLKGYRDGLDPEECVRGSNAGLTPLFFSDPNGYPVSEAEKERLYELRKNLVDFRMYNQTWQSKNNSYNYGVIRATGGWGKVTIRMNNYTNDMKYVIGYTPDYTLTIGSAPHQKYPYTWDFTKISGGATLGLSDNVYNSIRQGSSEDTYYDAYATNWADDTSGAFYLNTDNAGDYGSQYVPGAILVTTNRALSKYNVKEGETPVYAKDELDGLGFEGQVVLTAQPGASSKDEIPTWKAGDVLLNYAVSSSSTAETELTAGNGLISFGANKFEDNKPGSGNYAYKSDGDVGSTKYVLLKPSRPLLVGDIITIKALATSTPNGENYGLSLYDDNSSASRPLVSFYLTEKNTITTFTHTVTADDGLAGLSDIYVFRNKGYSTYFCEVSIADGATLYAAGTPLLCKTETTITVPDLNALDTDGIIQKQDWLYVSSSAEPTVVNDGETLSVVSSVTDGPDANQTPEVMDSNAKVYKYKVANPGNAYITFDAGTKIYKIGVTHILKEIHPVGGVGWATEIRKHSIDHALTGYFTKNDVNAYTVKYDSYDLNTATVALNPVNEDGYVPAKTGIVMKLDQTTNLGDANNGKMVPLFYPSYTRAASSTAVDFPMNNMMYQDDNGIDNDNRNYNERYTVEGTDYTKFVLTNIYWKYDIDHTLNQDETAGSVIETDAAGFYRMHIWKTTGDADVANKNTMPAHTAFLLVPSDKLPVAVWDMQSGSSGVRQHTIGIRNAGQATGIRDVETKDGGTISGPVATRVEGWYTISGVKLSARPVNPGLYIYNGRKVAVK